MTTMERHRLWKMWWSGALAAATFAHLLRTMTGAAVTIGSAEVPLWVSWVIVPVAGGASLWLVRRACGGG
jgi:hypothetical protein